ncbi:hypothetical protein OO012_11825 [Rhodobacteraceae bacterium KMM 6894]|nr:hypothetical protein [Rhodobacteraceae bacterium KMM 6894]
MDIFLPKDVQDGLDRARKSALRRSHRLMVEVDGNTYPVLRAWDGGFAVEAQTAPHLRGLVDLYDGGRYLSQCLIVTSSEDNGEWCFEYKRMTDASGSQPLDFERAVDAPSGLLEDRR